MTGYKLYSAILGLSSPWRITHATLSERDKGLLIRIRSMTGAHFSCPVCSGIADRDGEVKRRWLSGNFFNRRTLLEAAVPTVTCKECGTNQVVTPWERLGSSFIVLDRSEDDGDGQEETASQ